MKMLLAVSALLAGLAMASASAFGDSAYDSAILADHPVLYLRLSAAQGAKKEMDRSGHGNSGTYFPSTHLPSKTRLPNGEAATVFDGYNQYLEVASNQRLSVK